jgi:hypothetical protein
MEPLSKEEQQQYFIKSKQLTMNLAILIKWTNKIIYSLKMLS